ncbi:dihydrofolate reductase family protein, partial [Actinomadura sp. NPDC048032]|uniref:RibD family protein n=1 Tax=Actinomadura sp. NPDC048032 TaxID=3155747 RepID=UPI0033D7B0DC
MSERPYVLLSCAMSADGYIDDATPERLRLSSTADWDRVDAVRAGCDAILVGAGTVRAGTSGWPAAAASLSGAAPKPKPANATATTPTSQARSTRRRRR